MLYRVNIVVHTRLLNQLRELIIVRYVETWKHKLIIRNSYTIYSYFIHKTDTTINMWATMLFLSFCFSIKINFIYICYTRHRAIFVGGNTTREEESFVYILHRVHILYSLCSWMFFMYLVELTWRRHTFLFRFDSARGCA